MMLRYALLTTIAIWSLASHAQGIVTLTDEEGNVVNGTVVGYGCASPTDTVSLLAVVNRTATTTVNVRRYEVWVVPGTANFFCWGVCYLPAAAGANPVWVSQHPVDMNPGATYNNFHSYYQPQGQTMTARYRYVWYDMANPTGADSSWVDVQHCAQVGLEENSSQSNSLTAWPMPALGQDVQLDYTMDRAGVANQLVVYSILGEQVRRMTLPAAEGRVVLYTADLVPGVYFANIEREGRVLATRKLIVAR
ncbi:MAG: T9SS type A sorting domain-containing protein [Flavobacteriales bacterium]|nr:T9SS type A sorting domain-containing protein [Flavobacteriales bacterium]